MEMYKNHRKYIGTVSLGEARKLQDSGSDVSLEIPEGCHGVFMTHVHLGPSKSVDITQKARNRLISPTVEVHHLNKASENEPKIHTLNIPHCIPKTTLWKYVEVKKISSNEQGKVQTIPPKDETKQQDVYYTIDKHVIRVHTRTFSEFTCSICFAKCQASIMAFVLGKIEDILESKLTTVKIKAYMCSDLYGIRDFRNVS